MRLIAKTYWGPNRLSTKPCVVFQIDALSAAEESTLVSAHQALAHHLGERFGFTASKPGVDGISGFSGLNAAFQFLAEASLFILNHVRGDLDECGQRSGAGKPLFFVEFHEPELTVRAVKLLLSCVLGSGAAQDHGFEALDTRLNRFWDACQRAHPDFQAHALISAAKARKLNYAKVGRKLWLYGMGAKAKTFFETSTIEDLASGVKTNKLAGKALFEAVGAPTAPYRIVRNADELSAAIDAIGFPCVIKPVSEGAGRGVTAGIRTHEQVQFAYAEALKFPKSGEGIMVEQHIPGRDHRLLFVRGEFVACASSVAPFVIGDGVRNVRQLIDGVNAGRTRSLYRSGYLRAIKVDDSVLEALAVQSLGLDSVLPADSTITLRRNSNLGGGGVSRLFDHVHPDVLAMAQKIARHSGLHSVGIDYISEDISAAPARSGGKFTELNKMPGAPLLLAAGFDIVELGSCFLGEETRNIPLRLWVQREADVAAFVASYRGGCLFVLPDQVLKAGTLTRLAGRPGRPLLAQLLSDKTLGSLDIVATPAWLEQHGFPTEHLSEVIVAPSCMTSTVAATVVKLGCPLRQTSPP